VRITTKGEYALRALFDLVTSLKNTHVVSLEDISKRQGIPLTYLQQVFRNLRRAKIIASLRGPGGGYNLTKAPKDITIREVLEAVGDKPLGKPKSQKASTKEAQKVAKILEMGDKAIAEVLNKTLGDF
jgi:Rrf2 family protein